MSLRPSGRASILFLVGATGFWWLLTIFDLNHRLEKRGCIIN